MIRTQIYLTAPQRDRLAAISRAGGRPQSELVREAIDRYLEQQANATRGTVLSAAAGIWKDRDDLPSLRTLRQGWDWS